MQCSSVARRLRKSATLASILFISALVGPTVALAANLAPTISGTPATWVYVGSTYSFRPTASDPEGAALSFSIANKPFWASFSATTGQLYGKPAAVGLWEGIQIRVSDGVNVRYLPRFSIRALSPYNVPPTISGSPPTTATVGVAYSFQPVTADSNGDPLRFYIANRPSWASFDPKTGRLSGAPTTSHIGTYSNIVINVTDGAKRAYLPAFSITVSAANRAPTISGSPAASVSAGQAYSFRPVAADADGDALGFSIQNRPAWATFNTSTGQLLGAPTSAQVGTYSNIVISVSDGRASVSLPAFSIAVTQVSIGATTLSWTPPTQNTDGSTLTDLAGYRIHYGVSPDVLTHSIQIANPGIAAYVVENLSPGTYYFAVRAYTSRGVESDVSNLVSKIVE